MSRAMAFGFHTIWLGGCLTARALETTHQWLTLGERDLPGWPAKPPQLLTASALPLWPPAWWNAAATT